jgi:hypothetical protein
MYNAGVVILFLESSSDYLQIMQVTITQLIFFITKLEIE